MITFKKIGINEVSLKLLNKLPKDYGIDSIILDIKNNFISIIGVYDHDFIIGIIIARGEINRQENYVFVIHHVIAEDHQSKYFSEILNENLENWLLTLKSSTGEQVWKKIRQCSDTAIQSFILRRFYGEPILEVFEKNIGSKEKNAIRLNRQTASVELD